jgi:glycogenin glucosyltransferase
VFDYIIPVERIVNQYPDNLHLMNRTDLHSTFTKIALWKQVQFRKIVYVDADMVAIRAPDELFNLPHAFSAAPDIGWPDIFNTGLMVLTPNMGDYFALLAMAERGISFDGADQGLLNMHFKNTFNRLSFTYNVTPSAHYQYLPAFKHFQSSISMAHFIGHSKPWNQGRADHAGATPYDEMIGRWWAVYDKHYRDEESVNNVDIVEEPSIDHPQPVETYTAGTQSIVHYHTKGEFHPAVPVVSSSQAYQPEETKSEKIQQSIDAPFHEPAELPRHEEEAYVAPVQASLEASPAWEHVHVPVHEPEPEPEPEPQPEPVPEVQYSPWDASRFVFPVSQTLLKAYTRLTGWSVEHRPHQTPNPRRRIFRARITKCRRTLPRLSLPSVTQIHLRTCTMRYRKPQLTRNQLRYSLGN